MVVVVPIIDRDLCTLCGDCVASCPTAAVEICDRELVLDAQRCRYCGDCEDLCPEGAIALPFEIVVHSELSACEGDNHDQAQDCQD